MGPDGTFSTGSDFLINGGGTASNWYAELAPNIDRMECEGGAVTRRIVAGAAGPMKVNVGLKGRSAPADRAVGTPTSPLHAYRQENGLDAILGDPTKSRNALTRRWSRFQYCPRTSLNLPVRFALQPFDYLVTAVRFELTTTGTQFRVVAFSAASCALPGPVDVSVAMYGAKADPIDDDQFFRRGCLLEYPRGVFHGDDDFVRSDAVRTSCAPP